MSGLPVMDEEIQKANLTTTFGSFGTIEHITVKAAAGNDSQFAIVVFSTVEEMKKVLELSEQGEKFVVGEIEVAVQEKKRRNPKDSRGRFENGRGRGRGRGGSSRGRGPQQGGRGQRD
mmetsp:Transcript_43196/g.112026  ORF Transcript_43196/g.112026 Transcript_43196/m.112026 type:complete len:118 (+) Transcript_43196:1060-1413(+)